MHQPQARASRLPSSAGSWRFTAHDEKAEQWSRALSLTLRHSNVVEIHSVGFQRFLRTELLPGLDEDTALSAADQVLEWAEVERPKAIVKRYYECLASAQFASMTHPHAADVITQVFALMLDHGPRRPMATEWMAAGLRALVWPTARAKGVMAVYRAMIEKMSRWFTIIEGEPTRDHRWPTIIKLADNLERVSDGEEYDMTPLLLPPVADAAMAEYANRQRLLVPRRYADAERHTAVIQAGVRRHTPPPRHFRVCADGSFEEEVPDIPLAGVAGSGNWCSFPRPDAATPQSPSRRHSRSDGTNGLDEHRHRRRRWMTRHERRWATMTQEQRDAVMALPSTVISDAEFAKLVAV